MRSNYKKLGDYIRPLDVRNTDLTISNLQGVSIAKEFVPSIANIIGTDLSTYKIVRTGQFAYGPVTSRNGDKISIALLKGPDCIISSSYSPFEVYKPEELLPEYLMLWFMRPEFDRYARFMSNGSAREVFDWDCMCDVELPVPPIDEQRKIVHDYQVVTERIELLQKIDTNLLDQMNNLYRRFFIDYEPFKSEPLRSTKIGEIPASWKTGKLSEICEMLNGRAYSQEEMLTEGKYKLLRVGNFFTNDYWYYSDLELDENKYCYPGDLLFCWAATLGLYIWNGPKTIYHYHIWKVDFSRSSSLYREYVYLCLINEIANMKNAGHGSIMLHLTKESVENMGIVLPPLPVIKEFHKIIEPYINQRNTIQRETSTLARLKSEVLNNWRGM